MNFNMSISLLKNQYLRASFVLVIACVAMGVSFSVHSKAASETRVKQVLDPLFYEFYDSRRAHFELIKTSVIKECSDLDSSFIPFPTELKLYAQYKHDTTSIYILDRDEALSTALFVIRNGVCKAGYAEAAIRHIANKSPYHSSSTTGLTDEEVKGLFEDALVRHEKAFGGKAAFLKWLERTRDWKVGGCNETLDGWCPHVPYDSTILPFVMEILNNYRINGVRLD
jgi:hypothetical protein